MTNMTLSFSSKPFLESLYSDDDLKTKLHVRRVKFDGADAVALYFQMIDSSKVQEGKDEQIELE